MNKEYGVWMKNYHVKERICIPSHIWIVFKYIDFKDKIFFVILMTDSDKKEIHINSSSRIYNVASCPALQKETHTIQLC